jgi:hypothetical protein
LILAPSDYHRGVHLLYVDESGDDGQLGSPTSHFILSGILVEVSQWQMNQEALFRMRSRLFDWYGIAPDAELHSSELLGAARQHFGMGMGERIKIALHVLGCINFLKGVRLVRVIASKENRPAILSSAWSELLHGVAEEVTLKEFRNVIVICDYHGVNPSQAWLPMVLNNVIIRDLLVEKPFGRDSRDSHFLQVCDLLAYLSKQSYVPSRIFKDEMMQPLLKRFNKLYIKKGRMIILP